MYDRFNSLKILVHADKLKQIAAGELPYPIDWHIYPSNICNHSCSWCMFRQNNEQFDHRVMLSRDLLLKAVDDAARTGAVLIHFSGGGEPLLNKYTWEAVERASEHGISVALSTNGSHLDKEIVKNVDFIRVSLNAGTKEQHNKTNHANDGRSDWEKIIANIKDVVPYKKRDIGLAFVVDFDNVGDIYNFCSISVDCGVDFVHIRPAFWYDSDKNLLTRGAMPLAIEQSERAKKDFGDKLKIFTITEKFEGFWTPRIYNKCYAVSTGICLTATGDFAVCQDRTDLRFGKAYSEGALFEDVWHSEEHRKLIESIVSPGELSKCPRCVWNKRNEIIQEVFVKDEMRLDLV